MIFKWHDENRYDVILLYKNFENYFYALHAIRENVSQKWLIDNVNMEKNKNSKIADEACTHE